MACPFFEPVERLSDGAFADPRGLPLGDAYAGFCRANSAVYSPDPHTLRAACNPGYARNECPRFPDGPAPDAAHYSISRYEDGLVQIRFAVVRGHEPHAHGLLLYSVRDASFRTSPEPAWVAPQAAAYARSFLRRIS